MNSKVKTENGILARLTVIDSKEILSADVGETYKS